MSQYTPTRRCELCPPPPAAMPSFSLQAGVGGRSSSGATAGAVMVREPKSEMKTDGSVKVGMSR